MRRLTCAACLTLLLGSVGFGQVVVFENANVLAMDRNRVLEKQTVVIRDGKIAEIGAAARVKAPEGAVRVDATGKYLLPGLAEMHGHLPPPDSSRELVEHILYLYLTNGVTTVRGMLGYPSALQYRDEIKAGKLQGPRLYVAGTPFGGNVKTAEQAEKLVREQKAAGYDLLKITEGMPPAAYDAVVRTAREVKIDFAGHVPNDVGVRSAIAARQRSIDHLDNYIEALEAETSPVKNADAATRARELPFHVDESRMQELAKLTRDAGVWNVPTMVVWEVFFRPENGEALRASLPELRYLPKSMVDNWVKSRDAMLGNPVMGFTTGGKTGQRVMELRRKLLRTLHEAGAKIAFGTDSPQLFSVPGFSIHREMQLMTECGMTPYDVLLSATRSVAEYFGTQKETGTVEAGKRADLLLVEGNPLKDLGALKRRAGVVANGRWMPEAEIQKRLEQLAAAAEKL